MRRPLILAHRGDWRVAPENSIAAMQAALGVPGCDGLEFDVQSARDDVPVLLHDDTLDRVQGIRASVESLTADELAEHGIPTLAEVLAVVGREPFLDIELKGRATSSVIDVVEAGRGEPGGGIARAVVSSFRIDTLEMLADRRPGWPRWLNVDMLGPAAIEVARMLGCVGISARWQSIDERRAPGGRRCGPRARGLDGAPASHGASTRTARGGRDLRGGGCARRVRRPARRVRRPARRLRRPGRP